MPFSVLPDGVWLSRNKSVTYLFTYLLTYLLIFVFYQLLTVGCDKSSPCGPESFHVRRISDGLGLWVKWITTLGWATWRQFLNYDSVTCISPLYWWAHLGHKRDETTCLYFVVNEFSVMSHVSPRDVSPGVVNLWSSSAALYTRAVSTNDTSSSHFHTVAVKHTWRIVSASNLKQSLDSGHYCCVNVLTPITESILSLTDFSWNCLELYM